MQWSLTKPDITGLVANPDTILSICLGIYPTPLLDLIRTAMTGLN